MGQQRHRQGQATTSATQATSQPTERSWYRSLRGKLLIFASLMIIVPGGTFAFLTFSTARSALERIVGRQLAEIAGDVAKELDRTLDEVQADLRVWARQEVMRDMLIGDLDKRVSRFLLSMKQAGPAHLLLLTTDAQGRTVAATDPDLVGSEQGAEPWFRAAAAGRQPIRGPHTAYGRDSVLEIATPIRHPDDRDEIVGSLLLVYDWNSIKSLTGGVLEAVGALGLELDVLILGSDGHVISGIWRHGLNEVANRGFLDQPLRISQAIQRKPRRPGFVTEPSLDSLVGHAPLTHARLSATVLAAQPLDQALASVRTMQRQWAIVLAVVFVLAMAAAGVLANRMVRPLRELTAATHELAETGQPGEPLDNESQDEIGQLSRSFDKMSAQLEIARQKISSAEKFALVGEMAAGIAHEVRTPLSVLRSSAQILGRSLPPDSSDDQRELTEMLVDEVDRLEAVVAGMLELARPREPQLESIAVGAVLTRACDFVDRRAADRQVRIDMAWSGDPSTAICDPDQLYQVVLNLLMNALQATPAGGTITVGTAPARADHVGFEIEDDGPGMPEDVRRQIFTPFFTTKKHGTGLGLALVDRFVRSHRGTIEVESEPGSGTVFRIYLLSSEEPS